MPVNYVPITQIPETEPPAVPELWNVRYREIDERFLSLAEAFNNLDTQVAASLAAAYNNVSDLEARLLAGWPATADLPAGWMKFPNGLLIQWGVAIYYNGQANITFPVRFLNRGYSISFIHEGSGPVIFYIHGQRTETGLLSLAYNFNNLRYDMTDGDFSLLPADNGNAGIWMAIGY